MITEETAIHLGLRSMTHLKMGIIDFFECDWILNDKELSPIQKIMLKTVMGEPLDEVTPIAKSHPYQTTDFKNEIDMYKFFTGKTEYAASFYPDVDWCIGRRSGKCLAEGTEILTPNGPVAIEQLKVGDQVYGYNSDGSVSLTRVVRTYNNGEKEVTELLNSNKVIAACTKEHRWLTDRVIYTRSGKKEIRRAQQTLEEFRSKDITIAREFIKIPCGDVKEPHAYAIGALLGDGGRRVNHVGGYISSINSDIPNKISAILNTKVNKNSSDNYTYYIEQLKTKCNYYNEWLGERKAHEKLVDWDVVNNWDRDTLLAFVAGLLDTDGSVFMSSDSSNLNIQFGCQSYSIVKAFKNAFFKLWQHDLTIRVDDRAKYVNGPVYYVNCKSNLYTKMAVKELDSHLVCTSKKWKPEYSDLPEQRSDKRLGLKLGKTYKTQTYDIEVDNDTHLYVLANEGLVTHNSTKLGAGLAVYFATQFDYKPYLRTSPHATIPIISPTKRQAGEVYAAIKNMFLRSPYLYQTFLDGNLNGFKEEYSEEDIKDSAIVGGTIRLNNKVVIEVMAADVSKMRGMAVPFAILDECCFFGVEGNDTKNTDKGIYEALAPALTQFQSVPGMAMILKISSPNGQSGLMYDNYLNAKDPDVIHFQVPTWYANPTVSTTYLEKQKKKGMGFFNREYGAEYTASETSYLDPALIDECVIKGTEELDPQDEYRYVAAMDYATKDDYWTLAIGHKEYILEDTEEGRKKKERVVIDHLHHWRGSAGSELNPAEIVPEISAHLKRYKVHYMISDQYAYAPLRTLFQREGVILKEFKVTHQSKLKYMYAMQIAINSGVLKMVANPLAVRHLKDLREKRSTSSNQVRIEHASNSHDDYASVIALVVYQFDKSSPLYVGTHVEEKEVTSKTQDEAGKFVAYPTAQELAEHVGNSGFYDNRAEIEAREKKERGESDPEEDGGNGFWFVF